jgi:peptidoglycan hydrolase-like protein with peptidoglycan-binding domain
MARARRGKQLHVPFTRTLKRGARPGKDVIAVKRALIRKGALKGRLGAVSGVYGVRARRAVKKFQRNHKLTADGQYGSRTHKALVNSKAFDAYGAHLMRRRVIEQNKQPTGHSVAEAALYAASRAPRHYTQDSRRWQPVNFPNWRKQMWWYGDCSSFATGCYKQAGAPDPNGMNYRAGYTGTLAQHGRKVASPQPGDLALCGPPPTYTHTFVYVGGGKGVSHGSEGGPYVCSANYRSVTEWRRYPGGA